mmetsp:Transcript_35210/g.65584  ORF Transcript_35210/g.65584 Transcript_35210/m.65584 type:complete len:351 (-) Transcript_35210:25-1077(-)
MSGLPWLFFLPWGCGLATHVRTSDSLVRRAPCAPSCWPDCPQSSRTGVPCLPAADVWPYKTRDAAKEELGERVVAAARPAAVVSPTVCHGFKLFGDSAWCLAAFDREPRDTVGLSFGIEERDLWSETMSNVFHMPTKLYDCFQDPAKSPPLSHTAPNAAGSCVGKEMHCYETKYESYPVCLGSGNGIIEGRTYSSLTDLLRGRAALSVHLKMDVEGSEWSVLEALLDAPNDLAKVRTLDIEVHFGFAAASEAAHRRGNLEDPVRREVAIFERLAATLAVVGSNMETNAQGWNPASSCPEHVCEEPSVHTKGGFPVNQFAISFVNLDVIRNFQSRPSTKLAVEVASNGTAF